MGYSLSPNENSWRRNWLWTPFTSSNRHKQQRTSSLKSNIIRWALLVALQPLGPQVNTQVAWFPLLTIIVTKRPASCALASSIGLSYCVSCSQRSADTQRNDYVTDDRCTSFNYQVWVFMRPHEKSGHEHVDCWITSFIGVQVTTRSAAIIPETYYSSCQSLQLPHLSNSTRPSLIDPRCSRNADLQPGEQQTWLL